MAATRYLSRVNVIGMGEVGRRLGEALRRAGVHVHPVTRTRGWAEALADSEGLHLVCVREEALSEILSYLSGIPSGHVALVQNGWIRPLVHGRTGITRGLIWFTAKGEFFTVVRSSPFTGPMASELVSALGRGGIPAHDLRPEDFGNQEAEKMAFNCVVGLPLAVHGLSLSQYLEQHREEARAVFFETVAVCCRATDTEAGSNIWERFLLSAEPLGWIRVANPSAVEFRNGAVVELSHQVGIPAPANARLVEHVKSRSPGPRTGT